MDHLLPLIAARETQAFGRYMALAEDRVRASLLSFAAVIDVEAVVQETFLRVWLVADRIEVDGQGDSLGRFTIRVARNYAIDLVRRQNRLQSTELDTLTRLADEAAETPEPPDPALRRTLERCHQKLSGQPAAALQARIDSGGSEPDATLATRLGMRINTFLQNIGRARRLLAACLEKAGVALPKGVL